MKKIIFIPLFILTFLSAFAQKPIAGDRQVILGIQGENAGYLMLRSYYKNDMAHRYAFGGSGINYYNNPWTTYGGYRRMSNSFYVNSFLSYGIQKSFNGFEKIEPYIGIDYMLTFSISHSYSKNEVVDTSQTGGSLTYGDYDLRRNSGPTNMRLSLKPVAGFNYYIWKNFAVGIEYSINLFYLGYTIAGKHTMESQTNGVHSERTDYYGSSFNIGTSFMNSLAVTVNYTFGHRKNKQESKPVENSQN